MLGGKKARENFKFKLFGLDPEGLKFSFIVVRQLALRLL